MDLDPAYQSAKQIAFSRLDRRECSSQDIYRHLIKKGVSSEIASAIVSELMASNLIDDLRFTRMLARQQAANGKGPNVIRQKLREKGIQIELAKVREITEEVTQIKELDAAKAILERRYPTAALDRRESVRAYQALLRRGFSYSVVQQALKLLKDSKKVDNSDFDELTNDTDQTTE